MNKNARDGLQKICEDLSISKQAIEKILEAASELSKFEKSRSKLKTGPQQVGELDELKTQADALIRTLMNLSRQSAQAIGVANFYTDEPFVFVQYREDDQPTQRLWDGAVIELLDHAIKVVDIAKFRIGPSGFKGGRLKTLDAHSAIISNMAFVICLTDNITPGRGGIFERICKAVFSAAGVRSEPEGAIRKFLTAHGSEIRTRIEAKKHG